MTERSSTLYVIDQTTRAFRPATPKEIGTVARQYEIGIVMIDNQVRYCRVHRSLADQDRDNCHWDLWAGIRPGRGECEIIKMELTPIPDAHIVSPGPNEALRCSVDNGYLSETTGANRVECDECGRIYSWPGGYEIK